MEPRYTLMGSWKLNPPSIVRCIVAGFRPKEEIPDPPLLLISLSTLTSNVTPVCLALYNTTDLTLLYAAHQGNRRVHFEVSRQRQGCDHYLFLSASSFASFLSLVARSMRNPMFTKRPLAPGLAIVYSFDLPFPYKVIFWRYTSHRSLIYQPHC